MNESIPDGWNEQKFSDSVTLEYGKSPKYILDEQGNFPIIGTGGITGFGSEYLYDGASTVVGRKGTINKPMFIEGKFWTIDTTYYLRGYKNTDPKWFYYTLVDTNLSRFNEATGVPSLNRDTFYNIQYLHPPLPEQQKIASILTSVDEVIEKTESQIRKLQDLKKGMMQELLTKGIGHTEFKPMPKWETGVIAEIDKIPVSWQLVDILSVAQLESGHTPSRKVPDYWDGEFQWISLHDTKQLQTPVIMETMLTITQDGLDNSSARILPKGTVAFSRTASVGHCVILGREMATSQDFANYVCGKDLNNRYLLHMFRWMQHVWNRLAEGSTHKTIYMPIFKKLQILLPPKSEQQKIADTADGVDNKITKLSLKLDSLKRVKKSLMQDLLTGKVRV